MPSLAKNYEQSSSKKHLVENSQKTHVSVLVSMLDEKNKYIKVLHRKIDKMSEMIQYL